MAEQIDDGVFWLPSEFLTDEDLFMDFKTAKKTNDDVFSNGGWNSNSDLSSPVESVLDSAETESDEDEFITGLTRKMEMANFSPKHHQKGWEHSGSPQSTLLKPSYGGDAARLDLLYAAAEEVARRRMFEETTAFYSAKLFSQTPITTQKSAIDFYERKIEAQISYRQQLARQIQLIKNQEVMKNRAYQNGLRDGVYGRTQSSSMAADWPTLQTSQQIQKQTGSRTRPVFPVETGMKERKGTGVFLPQGFGTAIGGPTETRVKSAVLDLNMKLHSMDSPSQPRNYRNFTIDNDAGLKNGYNNVMMTEQRRNYRGYQQHPVIVKKNNQNQEIRLPQEWTY